MIDSQPYESQSNFGMKKLKIVLNKVDTYPALSTIKTSSDKEINIK